MFMSAIVKPHERTAAMSLVYVVKTGSQTVGPSLTGLLAGSGVFWVALVTAGAIKITYDLGLLFTFGGLKIGEEDDDDDDEGKEVEGGDGEGSVSGDEEVGREEERRRDGCVV